MKALLYSLIIVLAGSVSAPVVAQESNENAVSALKKHDVNQAIEIDADRTELDDRDGTTVLSGNVIVRQGGLTLKTERMTVYYVVTDKSGPQILRIDALTDVEITSESETVTGNWGAYDFGKRLITIGGDVKLTRENATLEGGLLQLNLITGLTTLDGGSLEQGEKQRVRGRFLAPPVK